MTITAINVFVEVDGNQHIAFIDGESASLFIGMLGAFQRGQPKNATLVPLHDDVSQHLIATRRALLKQIEAKQAKTKEPK